MQPDDPTPTRSSILTHTAVVGDAARVVEKAGMTHEGTLRQRELIKGAHRDIEVYSILRGELRGR